MRVCVCVRVFVCVCVCEGVCVCVCVSVCERVCVAGHKRDIRKWCDVVRVEISPGKE